MISSGDLHCDGGSSRDSSNSFTHTSNRNSSSSSSGSGSLSESPVWDHHSGYCSHRCFRNFSPETHTHSAVPALCLALHEGLLCGGQGDNQIPVWRQSDAAQVARLKSKPDGGAVKALLVADDKLFSAHQDKKIRVWRISKSHRAQHTLLATLPNVKDSVAARMFSGNNHVHTDVVSTLALGDQVLYSGSWDKTVKVWRLSDLKCIDSFAAHDSPVKALAANARLGFLYSASANDPEIKVWERRTEKGTRRVQHKHFLIAVLQREESFATVNALALSLDGSLLYAGASDSSISVWERHQGSHKLNAVLKGHQQAVLCLASLNDDLLCSGSADTTIRLWKRGTSSEAPLYTCLSIIEGHEGPVKSLLLSMDRLSFCSIFSCGLDGCTKMWRVSNPYGQEKETSEHYYFSSSEALTRNDDEETLRWKLKTISYALDEGAADHFRLVFDTLQL